MNTCNNANVWSSDCSANSCNDDSNNCCAEGTTRQDQEFVATEGQTLFVLTNFTYAVGAGSLSVYVNGVHQAPSEISEVNSTSFWLNTPASAGDIVVAEAFACITNDITTIVSNIFTEVNTLSDGQVLVPYSVDLEYASFYISGIGADNGRLAKDVDYTLDVDNKTITLTNSYPAGTIITLVYNDVGEEFPGRHLTVVENLSELRTITIPAPRSTVYVKVHNDISGAGGGIFLEKSASTEDDDNGVFIKPTDQIGAGRWERSLGSEVVNTMYGAIVDGVTDDTVANQATATFCENSGKQWVYAAGITIQDTVIYSNTAPTGYGESISIVRGLPGKDLFQYKEPNAVGWVRPDKFIYKNLRIEVDYSVDASVEGNSTYKRCDYFGQPIGNVGLAFPGSTDDAFSAAIPVRLAFENIAIWPVGLLANDGNNTAAFYWGVPSYGSFLKKLHLHALSFGWIDAPVSVRYIPNINTTSNIITFEGDQLLNGEIVTLLGETGTPPSGITPRTQLYYVINTTGNTCKLSLTLGGPEVNISTTGTGYFWLCKASSSYMEYSPDQNSFVHVDTSAWKLGFSLCNQTMSSITDCSNYTTQGSYRLLNYKTVNRSRGSFLSANGHYNEGSTDAGFTGENLRLEWDYCTFDHYYLTRDNASGIITGNRNKIDDFLTSVNPITDSGIGNKLTFRALDRSNISIEGLNPEIDFYPDFGGSMRIETPDQFSEKSALNRGSFESDWLETNPSSRYLSKRDLFIPGSQIAGFGITNSSLTTENDDTTLELNGYARIAASYFASGVDIRSRSGNATVQNITIGEYVPAARCRLIMKLRSDVVQSETIELRTVSPSGPIASVVITHTTAWQELILFDADLTAFASGQQLHITMNGLAASAVRDIAWIKFVPYAEQALVHQLKYSPTLFANLPSAATVGVGTSAFVTDSTTATFAAIVAGGGANSVPVYSDGTNWLVG